MRQAKPLCLRLWWASRYGDVMGMSNEEIRRHFCIVFKGQDNSSRTAFSLARPSSLSVTITSSPRWSTRQRQWTRALTRVSSGSSVKPTPKVWEALCADSLAITSLRLQYRMNVSIMSLVSPGLGLHVTLQANKLIYNGCLRPGTPYVASQKLALSNQVTKGAPYARLAEAFRKYW